jgi:hypothetical protein
MTQVINSSGFKDVCFDTDPHFKPDSRTIAYEILGLLNNFPYSQINPETDVDITDRLSLINDELQIDLNQSLISKEWLVQKLHAFLTPASELKSATPSTSILSHNPVMDVFGHYNRVSEALEKKKKEQFDHLNSLNNDLKELGDLIGDFQSGSSTNHIDFSASPEIKVRIDNIEKKWKFPKSTKPYVWENKNDVITFLTKTAEERRHRFQETMTRLQSIADESKSMTDIMRAIIEKNDELNSYIIRKTSGAS